MEPAAQKITMFRLPYHALTEKRQKTYKKAYIKALDNNDLDAVIHLTRLGTPIPDWNGRENSIVECLFFLQEDEYVLERIPLIMFLYEHGISNPYYDGNEKELILYHSLKGGYKTLIHHFLNVMPFNFPLEHWIMPYCIGAIFNSTELLEKWADKGLPLVLPHAATSIYAFNQRCLPLFTKVFPSDDVMEFVHEIIGFADYYEALTQKSDPRQAQMAQMTLEQIINNNLFDQVLELVEKKQTHKYNINANNFKTFILHQKMTATVPKRLKNHHFNKI